MTGDVTWDVQGLGVGDRMGRGGVGGEKQKLLYVLCTWTHLRRQKLSLGSRDMTWDVLGGLNRLALFTMPHLSHGASPSPGYV